MRLSQAEKKCALHQLAGDRRCVPAERYGHCAKNTQDYAGEIQEPPDTWNFEKNQTWVPNGSGPLNQIRVFFHTDDAASKFDARPVLNGFLLMLSIGRHVKFDACGSKF